MLKAIVFDFDGVVVDSEPVHFAAMLEVGRGFGASFDYEAYQEKLIGFDDRDALSYILENWIPGQPRGNRVTLTPHQLMDLCAQKQRAFDRIAAEGVPTVPGTVELIDQAAEAGFPIAIGSGATRADIELILRQLDRMSRFEHIVTANDVEKSKPHPQTYAMACEKLGFAPNECLAIEDTVAGLTSAKQAGLMTLALATTTPASELSIAQRVIPNLVGVGLDQLQDWYSD